MACLAGHGVTKTDQTEQELARNVQKMKLTNREANFPPPLPFRAATQEGKFMIGLMYANPSPSTARCEGPECHSVLQWIDGEPFYSFSTDSIVAEPDSKCFLYEGEGKIRLLTHVLSLFTS